MMRRYAIPVLTFLFALSAGAASAQAAPHFVISATNATMSASGASIRFTLTSVDGYAGKLGVNCEAANPPAGARLPYCGGGPVSQITLAANGTATGVVGLTAGPVPLASAGGSNAPGRGSDAGWAMAGVVLLSLGFIRRRARWLSVLLLVAGTLAGLATLNACGGGPPTLTPGTYDYTLTAFDTSTNVTAATTVKVTVPPGIPANAM